MGPVLQPLFELAGVGPAVLAAGEAVDRAVRHAAMGRPAGPLAAELALRSAVASASLAGHRCHLADVRAGVVTDPVVQGALRVAAAVDRLAPRWASAPRQVLARLHVLAARGCPGVDQANLGRPVGGPGIGARLDALCDLIPARADGVAAVVLRAAVVHGELLALGAFAGPNGVVARAAGRLTMITDGLDRWAVLAPEVGHLAREPEYVGAAKAFATGTADGVRAWIKHCAAALTEAAAQLTAVSATIGRGSIVAQQ